MAAPDDSANFFSGPVQTPEAPDPKFKSRKWIFTINNPTSRCDAAVHAVACPEDATLIGYQMETGSNGTPHWQGFIVYPTARSRSSVNKLLGGRAHLIPMRGTIQQSIDYCSKQDETKSGEYHQRGCVPVEKGQGARTDLTNLREAILTNQMTAQQVFETAPAHYTHQYGRSIQLWQSIADRARYRTTPTRCVWRFGPTGTGKSESVFADFNPLTHYVHNSEDQGWWDLYSGQPIVIIEDLRKIDFKFSFLLKLIDKYPFTVKRRNLPPTPFLATEIRVTSPLSPEDMYGTDSRDDIAQLLRRVEVIEHRKK